MKKFLHNLIWNIKVITTTSCWHQQNIYNKKWDEMCEKFLEGNPTVESGESFETHVHVINGVRFWTSNHPYASFKPDRERVASYRGDIRQSRKNILKLGELVEKYKEKRLNDSIEELVVNKVLEKLKK